MTIVDLPTLGRPTMATRMEVRSAASSSGSSKSSKACFEELGNLEVMGGGDADDAADPEGIEGVKEVKPGKIIDFIDGEDEALAGAEQKTGDELIEDGDPDSDVDNQNDDVGLFDGDLCLAPDLFLVRDLRLGIDPAGVDHFEGFSKTVCIGVEPVAGDPLRLIDNRDPLFGDPVEKGRFADIRASD